jgi:hypothetical protein
MKIIACLFLLVLILSGTTSKAQNPTIVDTIATQDLDNFYKYFYDHIRYPLKDRDSLIRGIVLVSFKIKDHKAYDIELQKAPSITLGSAVVTFLQTATIPSLQRTGVCYILPVFFEMQGDDIDPMYPHKPKVVGLQQGKEGAPDYYYFKTQKATGYKKIVDRRSE